YHQDLRQIKRRLTFAGVYDLLDKLEKRMHDELIEKDHRQPITLEHIFSALDDAEELIKSKFQSMFVDQIQSFRRKVSLFGLHFASIDIRQGSRVITRTLDAVIANQPGILPADFAGLTEQEQIDALLTCNGIADASVSD